MGVKAVARCRWRHTACATCDVAPGVRRRFTILWAGWGLALSLRVTLGGQAGLSPLVAQTSVAELPHVARAMGLTLAVPSLEGLRFDTARVSLNRTDLHMRWRHPGERVEVYVELRPEPDRGPGLFPHVLAGAAVTNAAVNGGGGDDPGVEFIARYTAGDEDLERLGADWACFYAFTPKPEFSARRYGYQASYYRAGAGLVQLWVLADRRESIRGDWAYVLPFVQRE